MGIASVYRAKGQNCHELFTKSRLTPKRRRHFYRLLPQGVFPQRLKSPAFMYPILGEGGMR